MKPDYNPNYEAWTGQRVNLDTLIEAASTQARYGRPVDLATMQQIRAVLETILFTNTDELDPAPDLSGIEAQY